MSVVSQQLGILDNLKTKPKQKAGEINPLIYVLRPTEAKRYTIREMMI